MVSLALGDIQGNVLQGYGFPLAAYLFLEVPDEGSGRRFLGEIVGEVTHADQWDDPPATTTNVALTCAGLRALGVADAVLRTLPKAFQEPIRDRAPRELDDTGPSAPGAWVEGLGTGRSHVLVMIHPYSSVHVGRAPRDDAPAPHGGRGDRQLVGMLELRPGPSGSPLERKRRLERRLAEALISSRSR